MQTPTAQTPPNAISRKQIGCLSPEGRNSASNQQILQHTNEFLTWLGRDGNENLRKNFLEKKLIVPPGDSTDVDDIFFKNLIREKVTDPDKYPILPTQKLACDLKAALDAAFAVDPNESIGHMSPYNRLLSREEQELSKVSQLSDEKLREIAWDLLPANTNGGKKRTRKKRHKKKRKTKRKKRTKKKTRKKRKSKRKKRTKKKTRRKRK